MEKETTQREKQKQAAQEYSRFKVLRDYPIAICCDKDAKKKLMYCEILI